MKTTLTLPSSNGVDTLHGSLWQNPDVSPKAVIQIVHGMCEYIDRYAPFAEMLLEAGYAVCGEDHLGHGRTAGENGLGYMAQKDGWDCMVEDVHRFRQAIAPQFPGVPYFLLGHSMGSFIARIYATRHADGLSGLLLSGTGGPKAGGNALLTAIRGMKAISGPLHRSEKVAQMSFAGYNDRYESPRTDKDWLTRDTAVVDAYLQDPHCMFLFTLSGYEDLLTLLGLCSQPEWAKLVPQTLPILLYSGDMDPVGGYGDGVREVARRLEEAGVADVTCTLYPGARHEMHNEINRAEVLDDLDRWLTAHL